jgi:hypothetical protein
MDNAGPHNLGRAQECIEASRVECLLHPAYILDLAPNDFFLFGYIKENYLIAIVRARGPPERYH